MEEGNAHESNVEDPLVDAAEKVDHDLKVDSCFLYLVNKIL